MRNCSRGDNWFASQPCVRGFTGHLSQIFGIRFWLMRCFFFFVPVTGALQTVNRKRYRFVTLSLFLSTSALSLSLSLIRRCSFVGFASKQRPPATAPLHIIIYSLIIASFHNDNYYTCTHSNVNLLGTTGATPSCGPIKK